MPFDEEELDPHGECAAEIARLRADIVTLAYTATRKAEEAERLRAALGEYGLHKSGCGAFDHHGQCTCGFDAAHQQGANND